MAMAHELAGGEDGRHELRAVDDRVETALQQADQDLARVALLAVGFLVDAAELLFGNIAVETLELLLGAELDAKVGKLALAALSVLAGTVFAAVDRALRATPDVFAHPAVDFVLGLLALCHRGFLGSKVKETRPPLPFRADRERLQASPFPRVRI